MSITLMPKSPEGVRVLQIQREAKSNALSVQMARDLAQHLRTANIDTSVRAVVLVGEGDRTFCAGLDLNEAKEITPQKAAEIANAFSLMFEACAELDKPLIAAVNGVAVGAGFGLVLAADFAVMAKSAYLGSPEIKHGVLPALILELMASQLSPKIFASTMLLGHTITATRAVELGLANEAVAVGDVLKHALEIARQIALQPAHMISVVKQTKRLLPQLSQAEAFSLLKQLLEETLLLGK